MELWCLPSGKTKPHLRYHSLVYDCILTKCRHGKTPMLFTPKQKPKATMTLSMSAKSVSWSVTAAKSSRSRSLASWLCSTRKRPIGRSSSSTSMTPWLPNSNDIEDVERHLPGLLRATNEWFRIYKIPDGKPENPFAFSGECKNRKYALEVIRECSDAWERLITGKQQADDISL